MRPDDFDGLPLETQRLLSEAGVTSAHELLKIICDAWTHENCTIEHGIPSRLRNFQREDIRAISAWLKQRAQPASTVVPPKDFAFAQLRELERARTNYLQGIGTPKKPSKLN